MSQVARTVSDLEALQLIRCVKIDRITSPRANILDLSFKGNCGQKPLAFFSSSAISIEVSSINGEAWNVSYIANESNLFILSLWMLRLVGLLGLVALYVMHRNRVQYRLNLYAAEVQYDQKVSSLAKKLSHDIRSPLTALKILVEKEIRSNERGLIKTVSERIEEIAEDLLRTHRATTLPPPIPEAALGYGQHSSELRLIGSIEGKQVLTALNSLVLEKRTSTSASIRIGIQETSGIDNVKGIKADLGHIVRICSNLIDNSIQAIEGDGFVTIDIERSDDHELRITIRDNGGGIPSSVLESLGTRQISFGKDNGNGLGVFEASQTIKEWGGDIKIRSSEGHGTTITLKLLVEA